MSLEQDTKARLKAAHEAHTSQVKALQEEVSAIHSFTDLFHCVGILTRHLLLRITSFWLLTKNHVRRLVLVPFAV
jgi:hypothetical protein